MFVMGNSAKNHRNYKRDVYVRLTKIIIKNIMFTSDFKAIPTLSKSEPLLTINKANIREMPV